MWPVLTPFLSKLSNCFLESVWGFFARHTGFVHNLEDNLAHMEKAVPDFVALQERLTRRVHVEEMLPQMKRLPEVNLWFERVDIELAEGHELIKGADQEVQRLCFGGYGSKNCWSSSIFGKKVDECLNGLDPMAISAAFSLAQHMGEKCISGIDCFVLKLSAEQPDLADRSDSTAEMIKHVMFVYFSQRSGLLVYLEDSYLTRIQSPGTHPTYWETTMATKIEDYRAVESVMIAHSGQSSVMITRFGDNLKAGLLVTRMEETWTIDDVAFNAPGLSIDCFIPPKEVRRNFPDESLDWRSPLHQ